MISRKHITGMCSRKSKMSERVAQQKAVKRGMRSYQCPVCGYWHLTKKESE